MEKSETRKIMFEVQENCKKLTCDECALYLGKKYGKKCKFAVKVDGRVIRPMNFGLSMA